MFVEVVSRRVIAEKPVGQGAVGNSTVEDSWTCDFGKGGPLGVEVLRYVSMSCQT